ncbi:MAG TPA: hypothetical protein PK358_03235 [Spirochaetota bacterium]|nr:hypothetical protein [Spirochaetota bacterium]HPJ33822.1 hypothetical protein [Spirochaetota bacterium]
MNRKIFVIILLFLIPVTLNAREFLNTVLHLNFGGMYSFVTTGDIIDSEESEINDTFTDPNETSHYETAYSLTLDIVPMDPIILGMESHAVKFGLRTAYKLHYLQQRVKSGDEYTGQVMDYRAWMVGPVIHYAPFIGSSDLDYEYTATGGFTFYALYGRLSGDLTAYPGIRDYGDSTSNSNTAIDGYKIDAGIGAEIALCALNFGMNVYYSYTKIRMKDRIYDDMGRNGELKEGCLEFYVGIPIETFIEPLIPRF